MMMAAHLVMTLPLLQALVVLPPRHVVAGSPHRAYGRCDVRCAARTTAETCDVPAKLARWGVDAELWSSLEEVARKDLKKVVRTGDEVLCRRRIELLRSSHAYEKRRRKQERFKVRVEPETVEPLRKALEEQANAKRRKGSGLASAEPPPPKGFEWGMVF